MTGYDIRRSAAAIGLLIAAGAALSGCQAAASTDDANDGSPPPDGVSISVYQPRPDVAKNRIAIEAHNDGAGPLVITGATLESSYFAGDFAWGSDRTVTVLPGYAIDLRVDIPTDAVCGDVPAEHRVTFSWTSGDQSGTSTVVPDDPFQVMKLLHEAACLVTEVDAVADITATSLTSPATLPAPADLLLTVTPTGATGTVTLDTITSTTLLNPAGPNGLGIPELPLGIELGVDGPLEVHVPIVPNRCDAHALAEDKVGTRMPLYVTTSDGTTGRLVLSASDELRAQMYDFYARYCGL